MLSQESAPDRPRRRGPSTSQVLVITSVMFTFISFWRTAAIVLCDLASTAYYIGGIVESQIGSGGPVVHPRGDALQLRRAEHLHRKLRDVRARRRLPRGQGSHGGNARQAVGLGAALRLHPHRADQRRLGGPVHCRLAGRFFSPGPAERAGHSSEPDCGAAIAVAITAYFWRVNIKGIHESSDRALIIMGATTIMGIIMIAWCLATLAVHPEKLKLPPITPNLDKKVDPASGEPMLDPLGKQVDPLGFWAHTAVGEQRPVWSHDRQLAQPAGLFADRDRVWPLDAGHERRGDSGPGLSRGRESQAQELQARGVGRIHLQFAVHVAHQLLRRHDRFPRKCAGYQVQQQPDRRPGDERDRTAAGLGSGSTRSWSSSAS